MDAGCRVLVDGAFSIVGAFGEAVEDHGLGLFADFRPIRFGLEDCKGKRLETETAEQQ